MAMATKSVSSFAVFIILFLVIFEMSEIEAQDTKCLEEYGGGFDDNLCFIDLLPPTLCYTLCREYKAAQAGRCIWNKDYTGGVKCFCDYCNATISDPTPSEMPEQGYPKCRKGYLPLPPPLCALGYPTATAECARLCILDKRPRNDGCIWGEFDHEGNLKCHCNFCSE